MGVKQEVQRVEPMQSLIQGLAFLTQESKSLSHITEWSPVHHMLK